MKFYFSIDAQIKPFATEDELEYAIKQYTIKNAMPLMKLLTSKQIDSYYHSWIMDLLIDPKFFIPKTFSYGGTATKTVPTLSETHENLLKSFVDNQVPNESLFDSYKNRIVYWYNPTTNKKEEVTLQKAIENSSENIR